MTHSFLANLGFNIVIPVLIMTRLNETLGALPSLLLALAFPLVYGLWDWWKEHTVNPYSVLGLVSVLLTGVIGVLALPAEYLAFKEAGIPFLVALLFFLSSFTKYDATTKFLEQMLDIKKLHAAYKKKKQPGFKKPILWVRLAFIGSFLFSTIMNYVLTVVVVTADPATPEFTAQVGRMTALSFPVIVLPAVIVLMAVLFFVFWHIKKTTGKDYEEFVLSTKVL